MLVADSKRIGERVIERQILPRVIAHRQGHPGRIVMISRLCNKPFVVIAAVFRIVLIGPRMRERSKPSRVRSLRIKPKRTIRFAGLIRLQPDRILVRQSDGPRIIEAAYSAQRAKGVVERAILLHQNDHVLSIEERALFGRRNRRRSFNHRQQQARQASSAR